MRRRARHDRRLRAKGADVAADVSEEPFGLLTAVTLPGGGRLGLYEPRHPSPLGTAAGG